jgi:hypothetical protein
MMAATAGVEEPTKKATSGLSDSGKTLSFFQQGDQSQGICFPQAALLGEDLDRGSIRRGVPFSGDRPSLRRKARLI